MQRSIAPRAWRVAGGIVVALGLVMVLWGTTLAAAPSGDEVPLERTSGRPAEQRAQAVGALGVVTMGVVVLVLGAAMWLTGAAREAAFD